MKTVVIAALAALLCAHVEAQELRATVNLTTGGNVSFTTSVANTSTAPHAITAISWAVSSGNQFDTFGTFSPAAVPTPDPGANADGTSHTAVVVAPTSPLMPGQTLTSSGGDIDPALPTNIIVRVTFANGTVLEATMTPTTAGVYTASLVGSLVPTHAITLTWVNPTQNEDGSAYTDPAGTKLYWGSTSGGPYANSVTVNNPAATEHEVRLPVGSYYFVATAINQLGTESEFSNQALGVSAPIPGVPTGLEQMAVDPEASGIAWLVFTVRNQILFAEAGTARAGAACDPQQYARGILPTDQMPHTLHLVAVEDVQMLPGLPADGEFALFAECRAQ